MTNKPKKVLWVDDSSTVLLMGRMVLERARYELVTAPDGREAVRKAATERPDLILMDVVMPQMNGFEACRKLKEQETTRNIPVILLTTRGEEQSVQEGFESGCCDYLTKPVREQELLEMLKNYLGE